MFCDRPALAEARNLMKILICCGSQQRDKLKEKQNPIPVEDLGETNYTSAGSPGKSRKCSAPKMLLQEPFFKSEVMENKGRVDRKDTILFFIPFQRAVAKGKGNSKIGFQ